MKFTKISRFFILLIFLFLLIFNFLSFGITVRTIPLPAGAHHIDAINVSDDNPSEIVFTTESIGAYCGGGTPAVAWKINIDPATGEILATQSQELPLIQQTRQSLYESSSGTLFTGGGWCGYKPPYYSTDGGTTWQPANVGTHPPNSTFGFTEYNGVVYAGTGYHPYPAEIYRWVGSGTWEKVFEIPTPSRDLFFAMTEYNNSLFVGSFIRPPFDWTGTTAVYISDDGVNFGETAGIPSSQNINQFLVADNQLLALTHTSGDVEDLSLYQWDSSGWQYHTEYDFEESVWGYIHKIVVSENGTLYTIGKAAGDTSVGFYESFDLGMTWQQFDVLDNYTTMPEEFVTAMHLHENIIYIGLSNIPEPTSIILFSLGFLMFRNRKM